MAAITTFAGQRSKDSRIGKLGQIATVTWSILLIFWLATDPFVWFWVPWDSTPTSVLIVVPVLLSATVPFMRYRRWAWSLTLVSALVVCLPKTDVAHQFFPRPECKPSPTTSPPITVLSWNTEFWGDGRYSTVGTNILRANADVVALQEVQSDVRQKYVAYTPPDFPWSSYRNIIRKGELMIATNLEVLSDNKDDARIPFLYVDIITPSTRVIRIINVHIPVHLSLSLDARDRDFYDFIRFRFSVRREEFKKLSAAIDESPYPVVLAGDFNSTTSMANFRSATGKLCDSVLAAGFSNPMTWSIFGLSLWRPDYIFTSPGVNSLVYDVLPMDNISDHKAIRLAIAL
ncbi:endonuclease/exonuclease/phosphatase family protein [Aliirhizobium smilacinae]|uniref:Endonuclease/exonuclease/phosphatase domain-containing protein n=1 Tax=Aliirhizobium smilacinae TaxID=1395944 RepID=A0A5C4X8W4_9HYPH|nr:endonuclease/exonuclease/phosphatase family protein [Rhizobium smilacinae]TNM59893.1 hypothetical protein FHP24_27375 [Rhizobium smilacinae]